MEIEKQGGTNKSAVAILSLGALAFAINSFDFISIFYQISAEFHQDVSFLGLTSAAMFIGIGLSQIPSGLLAAKFGPKLVITLGMAIISISACAVGLVSEPFQIVVLRFILGCGLALFFSPAIVMGSNFMKRGSQGLGAGIIVGSNAAGGVLALVGWTLIAGIAGWRIGIFLGAGLAAVATVVIFFGLPSVRSQGLFHLSRSQVLAVLGDKRVIVIAIMMIGSQASFEQILAFMPFYLQDGLKISPTIAGLVGSFALLSGLTGSPIVGWLYDKIRNLNLLAIILGAVMLFGVAINYFQTLAFAILSTIIVGFVGAGLFTLLSTAARETGSKDGEHRKREYETLTVNWVHAIALLGTIWAPILLSSSATQYGYSLAWPLIGLISIAIIYFSVLSRVYIGHC